jgi:hypothetical protein
MNRGRTRQRLSPEAGFSGVGIINIRRTGRISFLCWKILSKLVDSYQGAAAVIHLTKNPLIPDNFCQDLGEFLSKQQQMLALDKSSLDS